MHGSPPLAKPTPAALMPLPALSQGAVHGAAKAHNAGQMALRAFVGALARQAAREAFAAAAVMTGGSGSAS